MKLAIAENYKRNKMMHGGSSEDNFRADSYLALTNSSSIEVELNANGDGLRYRYNNNGVYTHPEETYIGYDNEGQAYFSCDGNIYHLSNFMKVSERGCMMKEGGNITVGDNITYTRKFTGVQYKGEVIDIDSDGKYLRVRNTIGNIDYLPVKEVKKMAKGGVVKYYNENDSYRLTPENSIEKEILEKVNYEFIRPYFAGNFGWKTPQGKLADGYLYNLDDYDQNLIGKLKDGEKVYRYFNRTSAIGGMSPFIKINIDKGLLYFLVPNDNDDIIFETKGTKAQWINLIESKMAKGGGVSNLLQKEKEKLQEQLNDAIEKERYSTMSAIEESLNRVDFLMQYEKEKGENISAKEIKKFLNPYEKFPAKFAQYDKLKEGGGVGEFKGKTNKEISDIYWQKAEDIDEEINSDRGGETSSPNWERIEKLEKERDKYRNLAIQYDTKMKTGGGVKNKPTQISFREYATYLGIKEDLIEPIYNIYMDRSKSSHTQKLQVSKAIGPENQRRLFKWFEWDGYLPLEIYNPNNKMKKGGPTKAQAKKVGKVMHEWKAGKLHSGSKKGPIVKEQKQAVAIALSEAGLSKKEEGGQMMGWKHKRKK